MQNHIACKNWTAVQLYIYARTWIHTHVHANKPGIAQHCKISMTMSWEYT